MLSKKEPQGFFFLVTDQFAILIGFIGLFAALCQVPKNTSVSLVLAVNSKLPYFA